MGHATFINLESFEMRLVFILLLVFSANLSIAETNFETSIASSTLKIGNSQKTNSANGNSLKFGITTSLQNNFFANGVYVGTSAIMNENAVKSTMTRGGIGYILRDNLSVWTGAGRKTSVELTYSNLSFDGGGYKLSDKQIDLGFSGKYAIAPNLFTDFKVSGSLNDPEKSYDAHLKLGYLLGFGEILLGLGQHRSVLEGTSSSMNYYTLGFAISR